MTIEEAIKKAIEGGYAMKMGEKIIRLGVTREMREADILLDRDFWSSLGKAVGWIGDDPYFCRCPITGEKAERNPAFLADCLCHREFARDEWKIEWHKFIDSLASGNQPSEYFKNL